MVIFYFEVSKTLLNVFDWQKWLINIIKLKMT